MLNNVTYILVADGSKARIYASDMNKHNLRLISILKSKTARIHSHDLGSEKPHGIFERNTPEVRVDLHAKEEERFTKYIAKLLNNGAEKHQFQNLVLISPSKFLGNLRTMLKKKTAQLISKEITKDLTDMEQENLKTYIWG